MTDPIAKFEEGMPVWGGKPSPTTEEIEAFLEDLNSYVSFHVQIENMGDGVATSQTPVLADGYKDVYDRHPKIRIGIRRALMVLGKRHLERLRAERVTGR